MKMSKEQAKKLTEGLQEIIELDKLQLEFKAWIGILKTAISKGDFTLCEEVDKKIKNLLVALEERKMAVEKFEREAEEGMKKDMIKNGFPDDEINQALKMIFQGME